MLFDRFNARPLRGRVAYGVHVSLLIPESIEIYGLLGFQWLFLDAEHGPLNHNLCRDLVRAADGVGVPCVVRVPEVTAGIVAGYLDAGVLGIMAPNVTDVEQAQRLVMAVKFSPNGARGAAGRSRAAGYGVVPAKGEHTQRSNNATFTIALIESAAGLGNLEDILSVPGIDYVGIGANDLMLSLGLQDQASRPQFKTIVAQAQARIRACGKPQLAVALDADQAAGAADAGAELIAIPDVVLLQTGALAFLGGSGS